jgi:hypothetical protein
MAKLCKGGVTLRGQIDRRWPKRDKKSDGWIADKHHAATSDHAPDKNGVVHAIDIDENMGSGRSRNGKTAQHLANQLITYAASGLPGANRLKYVVYEGRISSGTYKRTWWKWRGSGYGHEAHIHVSFTSYADRDGSIYPLPILTKSPITKARWSRQLSQAKRKTLSNVKVVKAPK